MKYEIMVRMLFDLLAKRQMSAKDLAAKYEVTTRTVYRYVEALELAGVPVERLRGANGGFRILPTFKLSSGFLTRAEYDAALSAITGINENVSDKNLESVIAKLKTLRRGSGELSVRAGNLVIDAAPWCDAAEYREKLATVSAAAENKTVLLMVYRDRGGETGEREIEPHVIAFKQGYWYVYAFCRKRNDFRFFKISRILRLENTGKTFLKRELPAELPFAGWYAAAETDTVTLKVSREAAADVEEWLGVSRVTAEGDAFTASAELPVDEGLVKKILSFGGGVRVVSPESLRKSVFSAAENVRKYNT